MKRVTAVLLASATLLVSGCLQRQDKQAAQPYDGVIGGPQALLIAEATFRHQFKYNASGDQQKAPAYFLSVFGKDPTPEFLDRFKDNTPPVRKGSEFAKDKGLLFRVERITPVSGTKVEVTGGYYEAELSSSGNTYTVELKRGKWVVTRAKMDWIS